MNTITLQGIIKDIKYSHTVQDTEYDKANLVVQRQDGKEDIIDIKFKKFSNPYKENDKIILTGNVRTYSQKLEDKNSVQVYVFTYFDLPEQTENLPLNQVEISGRICKRNVMKKTKNGKDVLDFILANNIDNNGKPLNVYVPVVAWGKFAKQINNLPIGTHLNIIGTLNSREYKKKLENSDDFEIRVAHEIVINNYEIATIEEDMFKVE